MKIKYLFIFFVIIILTTVTHYFYKNTNKIGILGDVHEHADFKLYLNGVEHNFFQERYMLSKNKTISNFIHLHDMNGDIIHKHVKGIKLGFFFNTLKMKFNSTCFVLDNEVSYCNENDKTIKLYVNGIRNYKYENYEFRDLDKILITYSNETDKVIKEQINSVTNKSCIYSEKCPELGKPPEEASCIGNECAAE